MTIQLTPERADLACRLIRDVLYGKPTSTNNWEACRENWKKTFSDIHDALRAEGIVIEMREMKPNEL